MSQKPNITAVGNSGSSGFPGATADQYQSHPCLSAESGVQQGAVLSRTLHVHISGSLSNLAMAGPSGGMWKFVDGKQLGAFGMGTEVDANVATNQLRTALIHEVTVLQDYSTFPVPLGVTINCIPSQEITDLGERYAYTVMPLTEKTTTNEVYRCDGSAEEGLQVSFFLFLLVQPVGF